MVNGAKLEEYDALADGDVVGIGPFALNIDFAQGWLVVKVSLQIAALTCRRVGPARGVRPLGLADTARLEIPSEAMLEETQAGLIRENCRRES